MGGRVQCSYSVLKGLRALTVTIDIPMVVVDGWVVVVVTGSTVVVVAMVVVVLGISDGKQDARLKDQQKTAFDLVFVVV